jgi:hypothetical protein
MGLLREGPYHYTNPGGTEYPDLIGVGDRGSDPFYKVDGEFSQTNYGTTWMTEPGRLLPESYSSYIVPFSEVTGFTESDLNQTPFWNQNTQLRNPSTMEWVDSRPLLEQVGIIPSWYGLDIPSGGYTDDDKHWITPEGQYRPDDFRWQYSDPSLMEGSYLSSTPGLLGLDENGDPYSGWIPGQGMRGQKSVSSGEPKVVWGPDGNAYWIESQADLDAYGFNPLPSGPPSSVMKASEAVAYPDVSWVPYNPLPITDPTFAYSDATTGGESRTEIESTPPEVGSIAPEGWGLLADDPIFGIVGGGLIEGNPE